MAKVIEMSSCAPEGCRFNSLLWCIQEATDQCFCHGPQLLITPSIHVLKSKIVRIFLTHLFLSHSTTKTLANPIDSLPYINNSTASNDIHSYHTGSSHHHLLLGLLQYLQAGLLPLPPTTIHSKHMPDFPIKNESQIEVFPLLKPFRWLPI